MTSSTMDIELSRAICQTFDKVGLYRLFVKNLLISIQDDPGLDKLYKQDRLRVVLKGWPNIEKNGGPFEEFNISIYIDDRVRRYNSLQERVTHLVKYELSLFKNMLDIALFFGYTTDERYKSILEHYGEACKDKTKNPFVNIARCSRDSIIVTPKAILTTPLIGNHCPLLLRTPLFCSYNNLVSDQGRALELLRLRLYNEYTHSKTSGTVANILGIAIMSYGDAEKKAFFDYHTDRKKIMHNFGDFECETVGPEYLVRETERQLASMPEETCVKRQNKEGVLHQALQKCNSGALVSAPTTEPSTTKAQDNVGAPTELNANEST